MNMSKTEESKKHAEIVTLLRDYYPSTYEEIMEMIEWAELLSFVSTAMKSLGKAVKDSYWMLSRVLAVGGSVQLVRRMIEDGKKTER